MMFCFEKSALRKQRCQQLFGYFQKWKIQYLKQQTKPQDSREPVLFTPPKPTQIEGIALVLETVLTRFCDESFVQSLRDCFVAVGLAMNASKEFNLYDPSCARPVPLSKADTEDKFQVSDVATELELIARPSDDEDELKEDDDGDADEESEDSFQDSESDEAME